MMAMIAMAAAVAGAEDCGTLTIERATTSPEPVRVWVDGVLVAELAPSEPPGTIAFPSCGLVQVRIHGLGDAPELRREFAMVADPAVHVGFLLDGWGPVVRDPIAGPRCLRLDPPTFGWACNGAAIPPDGPYDLRSCVAEAQRGDLRTLTAQAMNQDPLELNLVPSLPGLYTASVEHGAIAIRFEAGVKGCR